MEFAIMRWLKRHSLLVETLEAKVVLSSSGAVGHLEVSRPAHVDLSKVDDVVALEGKITGSAVAFTQETGFELIGGTAFVRPLGSLRVSNGTSAYMFLRNPEGGVTARVAVGFVDLEKPEGHQWAAMLSFEVPQTDTTYGKANALEYTLQRWIPASLPGGSASLGNVIRSGKATLRFPLGPPTTGEAAVPFDIVLHRGD
jgi:hypothetical protein